MEVNTFYISFLRLVLSLRGGIGTGTFIEIIVLVGENRMRCQSVKVKVSNSLWHFIREGWLLTVSLKGGLFGWKL